MRKIVYLNTLAETESPLFAYFHQWVVIDSDIWAIVEFEDGASGMAQMNDFKFINEIL